MRKIPVWSWTVAMFGLAAIIAGGFFDGSYAQSVLLQLGSTALLLIPILLVERAIGRRLESQLDDRELIRRADALVRMDETWRDFGQKLAGKIESQPVAQLERVLTDIGWEPYKTLDGYKLWRSGSDRVALPSTLDGAVRAPHVRAILRRIGWTDEQYLERFPPN
jgi:hypothetical protein